MIDAVSVLRSVVIFGIGSLYDGSTMMISKRQVLSIVWIVGASILNGCIMLSLYPDTIDYEVEIDIKKQCQKSEYCFLVFNHKNAMRNWGYKLYESALISSSHNLWLVPRELMHYSKTYDDPSIQYPKLGDENSLSELDLSGATNIVHNIFEQKYKVWRERGSYAIMFGPADCDEAWRLYYHGTPICVDLMYANMAMEHVLTAVLLRNHYPTLPQFEERVTYIKGCRFSNSRGGNPFAVLGWDICGNRFEIIGKGNEKIGAVAVRFPWSYGVLVGDDGLCEALAMAVGRMFEMIYSGEERVGLFKGVIRFARNGTDSKLSWVDEH